MTIEGNYCNNRFKVSTEAHEMKMSHWVYAPKIENLETGEVLLDLTGDLWDLVAVSEEGNRLKLQMRKYPGSSPEVIVAIETDTNSFFYNEQVKSISELLNELETYA